MQNKSSSMVKLTFKEWSGKMKICGLFLDERLTNNEMSNLYDQCIGCLNRICVTDDMEEVLTMLASLQIKAMLLGKNTFMRIDSN